MKNNLEFIKGKKITVMGLGLLGGAVNDAIFLAKHGADLTVTDLKTKEELAPSLEKLREFKSIKFVLGEHRLEDFRDKDFILQPGNVPLDSPYLAEARKNNIPVHVSESLFAEHTEAMLVGITGTRGKSTTTHMIFEILQKYSPQDAQVYLGGNVKDVSTLSLLEEAGKGDIVVLELDSWALHGMGNIKKSPHIAIFTTFFDDHLNFYKGDRDLYLEDKAQIFKHQSANDYLVLGEQTEKIVIERYKEEIKSKVLVAKQSNLPDVQLHIPGEHNRQNAACAYEALKILGLTEEDIKKGLEKFKAVPGRLEYLGEKRGIKIYNDTTATTPEAAIAALKALDNGQKNIILIAGGSDKELNMNIFIKEAKNRTKETLLLKGTGTEKIKNSFQDSPIFDSLEEAVNKAFALAKSGDSILLSPAFASFGMFKNEFDRGEQFKEIIQNM